MGDRFYTEQNAYLKSIGKLKTTTDNNKESIINFIEAVMGLDHQLQGLHYCSLYVLEKLKMALIRKYG